MGTNWPMVLGVLVATLTLKIVLVSSKEVETKITGAFYDPKFHDDGRDSVDSLAVESILQPNVIAPSEGILYTSVERPSGSGSGRVMFEKGSFQEYHDIIPEKENPFQGNIVKPVESSYSGGSLSSSYLPVKSETQSYSSGVSGAPDVLYAPGEWAPNAHSFFESEPETGPVFTKPIALSTPKYKAKVKWPQDDKTGKQVQVLQNDVHIVPQIYDFIEPVLELPENSVPLPSISTPKEVPTPIYERQRPRQREEPSWSPPEHPHSHFNPQDPNIYYQVESQPQYQTQPDFESDLKYNQESEFEHVQEIPPEPTHNIPTSTSIPTHHELEPTPVPLRTYFSPQDPSIYYHEQLDVKQQPQPQSSIKPVISSMYNTIGSYFSSLSSVIKGLPKQIPLLNGGQALLGYPIPQSATQSPPQSSYTPVGHGYYENPTNPAPHNDFASLTESQEQFKPQEYKDVPSTSYGDELLGSHSPHSGSYIPSPGYKAGPPPSSVFYDQGEGHDYPISQSQGPFSAFPSYGQQETPQKPEYRTPHSPPPRPIFSRPLSIPGIPELRSRPGPPGPPLPMYSPPPSTFNGGRQEGFYFHTKVKVPALFVPRVVNPFKEYSSDFGANHALQPARPSPTKGSLASLYSSEQDFDFNSNPAINIDEGVSSSFQKPEEPKHGKPLKSYYTTPEEYYRILNDGQESKPTYSYKSARPSYSNLHNEQPDSIYDDLFSDIFKEDNFGYSYQQPHSAYGSFKPPGSVSDDFLHDVQNSYGTPDDLRYPTTLGYYRTSQGSWARVPPSRKVVKGYRYKYQTTNQLPDPYRDPLYQDPPSNKHRAPPVKDNDYDAIKKPDPDCENSHRCGDDDDMHDIAENVDLTQRPRGRGIFRNKLFKKLMKNAARNRRPSHNYKSKGRRRPCRGRNGRRCRKF